jgi:hypothetical protein
VNSLLDFDKRAEGQHPGDQSVEHYAATVPGDEVLSYRQGDIGFVTGHTTTSFPCIFRVRRNARNPAGHGPPADQDVAGYPSCSWLLADPAVTG